VRQLLLFLATFPTTFQALGFDETCKTAMSPLEHAQSMLRTEAKMFERGMICLQEIRLYTFNIIIEETRK
jgi:hypothetical protein